MLGDEDGLLRSRDRVRVSSQKSTADNQSISVDRARLLRFALLTFSACGKDSQLARIGCHLLWVSFQPSQECSAAEVYRTAREGAKTANQIHIVLGSWLCLP